jgi:hypothetical protein
MDAKNTGGTDNTGMKNMHIFTFSRGTLRINRLNSAQYHYLR